MRMKVLPKMFLRATDTKGGAETPPAFLPILDVPDQSGTVRSRNNGCSEILLTLSVQTTQHTPVYLSIGSAFHDIAKTHRICSSFAGT
jgi:hypothetical protein